MDNFTITTLFTKKDYTKFLYTRVYKNPFLIIITLIGAFLLMLLILNFFGIVGYDSKSPYIDLVMSFFLLLTPVITVLTVAKVYYSNPSLQHEITYIFGEEGISVKGLNFENVLKWPYMIKLKETKKYLLLYSSKKLVNFIAKDKLTEQQIQFIKSKIKNK
jgi:YcxB-like protein